MVVTDFPDTAHLFEAEKCFLTDISPCTRFESAKPQLPPSPHLFFGDALEHVTTLAHLHTDGPPCTLSEFSSQDAGNLGATLVRLMSECLGQP